MLTILNKECKPTRGSKYSACIDLYSSEDVVIGAGETKLVGLGVAIGDIDGFAENHLKAHYGLLGMETEADAFIDNFKRTHYLQLMLRSSLGKKGLILPNGVGVIDLDYKDEIKMIIHNPNYSHFREYAEAEYMDVCKGYDDVFTIKKGDRIAQITLLEHHGYLFDIETEEERNGGFGSTNKQDKENKDV